MSGKYVFTKGIKEVRFLFCQISDHSAATRLALPHAMRSTNVLTWVYRSFLTRAYPTMKKNNPHTPIMLREALGFEPRVFARYGKLESISLVVGNKTNMGDQNLARKSKSR